jgi:hypothetical protein
MKTLKQYLKCVGCESELYECYEYQQMGFDAGLEFGEEHLSFFAIDKDGSFIVPIYWRGKQDGTK